YMERARLNCHVCSETFRDPVSLHCNHSFCKSCVEQFWEKTKTRNCPICKRKSSLDNLHVNFSLKDLADSYSGRKRADPEEKTKVESSTRDQEEERELICCKHTARPKWFCVDEEKAICPLCVESVDHSGHKVIPVEDAVSQLKEKLKTNLESVQEQLKRYKKIRRQYEDLVQHQKKQFVSTERQIKEEFEKLHQFLRDEEEARLAALREEEEQKSETISREMKAIQDQISSLSDRIRAVEQNLEEDHVPFLKVTQSEVQDPEVLSGTLIDVAKHLGSLSFKVWEKMLHIVTYTPVTLDPNTANPWLSMSDDLTCVRFTGVKQQLPDNTERFSQYLIVLGSEGFTSGQHSWEVEVGNKTDWIVGVITESINRKGEIIYSPEKGLWVLLLKNGDQYKAYTAPPTLLMLKSKPQRIWVQVDYDRGEVSFFSSTDMSHIYTFKDTFTEKLFPFFSPCLNKDGTNPGALKICPVKVS
uniref:Nuclear factor 7, brain-like n=1 Tax=Scleropages formosus TaxID=113540 RepID=A0A8C9RAZ6_SCLFO